MTDITPEAIARLLEGVTPAPWHADCTDFDDVMVWAGTTSQTFVANIGQRIAGAPVAFDCEVADGRFIAAARDLVPAQAARIAELEAELRLMKTAGAIEVAVRNPNVADYVQHWEARAERAEAEVARLRNTVVGCVRTAAQTARDLRRHAWVASLIVDSLEANNARACEVVQEKPHE